MPNGPDDVGDVGLVEVGATHHGGAPPRGLMAVPKSPLFKGRFGRMFRNLPIPRPPRDALIALGDAMSEERRPPATADNAKIPAAYTYLGQFVDHDITFDPVSKLQRLNDPDALVTFRTPRYDLDSLYGWGPSDTPYLYEWLNPEFSGVKPLAGRNPQTDPVVGEELDRQDLPRNEQGRALIGDPRNDENIVVGQLQHSMIRPDYDLNEIVTGVPIFSRKDRPGNREHLGGFRRLPSLWTIDWSHFLKIDRTRPQPSRKINIRLARSLMKLPADVDAGRNPLAVLNLRRGKALQLPSGQSVAQHVGQTPLMAAELELSTLKLKAAHRTLLEQDTPLWFYVLKEAEVRANGERLGQVGGRIVAEVLIGLLQGDPKSFLSVEPTWKPAGIPVGTAGEFTLADLLTFATR
jgi:hypothetical protein